MPLRRYAPFLLIAATLLMVVVIAPSRPSGSSNLSAYPAPVFDTSTAGGQGASADPGATAGPDATAAAGGTGSSTSGGTTGGGPTGASTGPGATTAAGAGGTGAKAAGDTTHCAGKYQFAGIENAPPCTPTFAGNNGGATYAGVTDKTIEIVYYREADDAVVKAYEQNAGIYSAPADQMAFVAAVQKFANAKYELYGRQVHVDFFMSASCKPSAPDETCYRTDARQLVSQYHPFGVIYDNNTNTPYFFDELSKAGVINFGGWHLADSFSSDRRPYHYDVYTGGDTAATLIGEWYCKRLAGQPVKFSDAATNGKPRKVAVIVQNVDLDVAPAQHLASIINKCEAGGAEVITYDPDTASAASQSVTIASQMKQDGITTTIYTCDPIAPQYFTQAETRQNYYPEMMIGGTGLLDYDVLAQGYDAGQMKHAFGLSFIGDPQPLANQDQQLVWNQGGGTGPAYTSAALPWSYFSTILDGIMLAGPNLNPGSFEKALLTAPATPNAPTRYYPGAQFGAGKYTAIDTYREVSWNPTAVSPSNNKAGSWVSLNDGKRYGTGQAPSGQPAFPNQP